MLGRFLALIRVNISPSKQIEFLTLYFLSSVSPINFGDFYHKKALLSLTFPRFNRSFIQ